MAAKRAQRQGAWLRAAANSECAAVDAVEAPSKGAAGVAALRLLERTCAMLSIGRCHAQT
ncbi:hypothetical protein XcmpCFBP7700_15785 [Xanthomonas campestris]|nr:hypothetical protein XcmpCFBP7700_15785 [Xanthomonas campestris]